MATENTLRTRQPWYAAGLRFVCQGCGKCCGGVPGYVWVEDDEVREIAKCLDLDVETFQDHYTRVLRQGRTLNEKPNYDCVLLDGAGRCTIYSARPAQCRAWPFWPSNLQSRTAWSAAGRRCPGIGQGPLHRFEQIEAKRMKSEVE